MRRWVLVAIMAGVAQSALAADMPDLPVLRGFVSDAPRSVRTNWEGFYVGGQGGFTSSQMNFAKTNANVISSFNANYSQLFSGSPVALPGFPGLGTTWVKNVSFGGFAGYNAQWDDAVVGVEINYSHVDLKGRFTGVPQLSQIVTTSGFDYQAIANSTASLAVHDFGTLRARGGWAVGSFMPYAFAGLALASGDLSRSVTATVTQTRNFNQPLGANAPRPIGPITVADTIKNRLLYGYTAGLGTEVCLFGSLFARVEYEYVRLTSPVDVNINSVRGGIGYKF
jgi:outer membrane immunogenic protein